MGGPIGLLICCFVGSQLLLLFVKRQTTQIFTVLHLQVNKDECCALTFVVCGMCNLYKPVFAWHPSAH